VAVAKDPKTDEGRAARGGSRATATRSSGGASRAGGGRGGQGGRPGGRGRPVQNVVAKQRPWGLIAGAVAVALFAVAVLVYAVLKVKASNAYKADSPSDIAGLKTFDYAAGQAHVTANQSYKESPPVGGPHDPYWADCTGTVYTVDIRHENAVHGLEHGGVWITYNPDKVSQADIAALTKLVQGQNGRMLSPYAGQDTAVSIQSWDHQLKVGSATDPRLKEFADFFALNPSYYPEIGASCQNPDFKANPVVQGQPSEAIGSSDPATSATPASGAASSAAPSAAPSSSAAPATSTAP
jgi:Protein of unknown function (DUF3105)